MKKTEFELMVDKAFWAWKPNMGSRKPKHILWIVPVPSNSEMPALKFY